MNKEEFLEDIHRIPMWIKSADDLLNFSRHLSYRLVQAKKQLEYYTDKFNLNEDEDYELLKISSKFDEWYRGMDRGFIPFEQIIKENKEFTNK
jgi:hypothetical protein